MSPNNNFVDLTMEDEEDVVVVASNPVRPTERAVAWEYAPWGQAQPASSMQTFSPRRTNSPLVKHSPGSRPAVRLESNSARPTPQGTPSKSARFSVLGDPELATLGMPSRTQLSGTQSVPQPSVSNLNPRNPSPQPPQHAPREQHTPRMQTPNGIQWTVDQIASKLETLAGQVRQDHGRLVEFMLEEAEKMPEPTHPRPLEEFADMKSIAFDPGFTPDPEAETIWVKFKQHSGEHGKHKGGGRRSTYPVLPIKCDKEPVPSYRFHHVEIRKNILTPNTMLNFIPHLRDVDPNSAEEKKYTNWLSELDKLDTQSGFKTQDRLEKLTKREREEYAEILSMYLEPWLRKLALDGCTKSTLIRFMASQPDHDDAITPKQRSTILNTYSKDSSGPQTDTAARLFTEAFDRVFNCENKHPRASLHDILLLDKSVETIVDNKLAKETPSSQRHQDGDLLQHLERNLASYACLGCLICFSHDCEHGEFDAENQRVCFATVNNGGLTWTVESKWRAQIDAQGGTVQPNKAVLHQPCKRDCYRAYDVGNPAQTIEPWSSGEVDVLKAMFTTMGYSASLTSHCFVAAVLGRPCWDVRRKFVELNLSLPPVEPRPEPHKIKPLPWYDRKKKQLFGNWEDCTTTHEHSLRTADFAPCCHDGPCTKENGCTCASNGPAILCDRFCTCTAEECALKFTGCACHSAGKTCLQNKKDGKGCICILLNRECDPVLCKGCGAKDRADPENTHDDHLHATGCQNVPLQRGASKVLLLGQSQLEGCGYGLFTAEDIAQDEFIIEYTGELITHDEGVRREARRGDVFDEAHSVSYLFTLLEEGGIWVDAAIYGNLSRYINHASEHDKKGCNITPKIVYVNHEFRIKFTALRDIKAGEELFFNYGDNFPNLTKKLLEQDEEKPGHAGGKGKNAAQRGETARKTTAKNGAKGKGKKRSLDPIGLDEDDPMYWANAQYEGEADDWEEEPIPRRRKKRGGRRPGAGRKKKVVVDAEQPRTEINDSQDESSLNPSGTIDTPSRSRRLHGSGPELGTNAGTRHKPAAVQEPPVKKVSKRGGARPGAGRKPKHPKPPVAPKATDKGPSDVKVVDGATPDQDGRNRVLEFTSSFGAAAVADNPPAGPSVAETVDSEALTATSANRKRKAIEIDSGEDEIMAITARANENVGGVAVAVGGSGVDNLYHQDHFQLIDDEDDDDESIADRPRKRQKPLRYRHGEH